MADKTTSGGSFPTEQLYTGRPFWRSDLGLWFKYNGSEWVTAELFTVDFLTDTVSGTATTTKLWLGDANDVYYERVELATSVDTTNDSDSYWRVRVLAQDLAQANTSIVKAITTDSDSPDTQTDNGTDIDNNLTYCGWVYLDFAKQGATGTPGDLTYSATLKYRLIYT